MAFEWVAGLFQSEEARGLSGESASSVALDDANPYYNYRLRRHVTEGDLVADPGVIWYTSPYVTQRQGLGTHVAAEPGEGVTNYTDVLLILSRDDFDRAQRATGEAWSSRVARTLQQEFENFCRRENLQRPHAHRPLGFRLLCDGSPEMHGLSLNLQRGEFVTGLLPNLYTGTVFGSYPVIGVHVNLPGVWEGYREVGRLHNDQILFTLGNHWLDNFSHPALAEAALYRLQQYPDGSFVHIVNPDLQDRYQVTSTVQNNASVLTLATREGRPLAYLVLAVMEPPSSQAPTPTRSSTPRIDIPQQPAARGRSDFDQPIPSVAPPMLIDDEVQPVLTSAPGLGGKTIIPDAPSERIFTLQERGALLQKVHFSAFMLGYDVHMGQRGELGTKVEHPAATFEVRKRSTALVAHVPGVMVDGDPVPVAEQIPLDRDCEISVGDTRFEFRDLRKHLDVDGWPYVGEIRRPASSTYLIWGETYRVGRSRECRVVLPDQTANDNIHWKPNIADGGYIRARTGDIPMANFYTDSIMVSSEHATIDLSRTEPRVECNASHCYVFVRRAGELLTLHPSSKSDHAHELTVTPGDEVLIGNCLFQVGFSPSGAAAEPAPAPAILFSADSLANAVPSPNFEVEDDTAPAPPLVPPPLPPAAPVPVAVELDDGWDDEPNAPVTAEIFADDPASPAPPTDEVPEEDDGDAFRDAFADDDDPPGAPVDEGDAPDEDEDDEVDESAETAMWTLPARDDALADPPAAAALGERGNRPAPYRPAHLEDSILGEPTPELPRPPEPLRSDTFNSELGDPDDEPSEPPPPPRPGPKIHVWDEDQPGSDLTEPPAPAVDDGEESAPPPLSVPAPFPDLVSEDEATAEALPASLDDDAVTPPPPPRAEPPPRSEPPPPPRAEAPPPPPRSEPPPPPRAEAPPPPRPEPPPSIPAAAAPRGLGPVVATDDAEAQFELGRPCHVILAGWMLNGEAVVGNHQGADLVLPENRIDPDQEFTARDYLRIKVRGRKGTLEVLSPTEVLIDEADAQPGEYDDVEAHTIDVIRRDADGEEDFAVRLQVREDKKLPDPRARLVALDYEDALAAALVTRGLPRNQPRTLTLGGMSLSLTFDGAQVAVADYLASYRDGAGGFRPFFVQSGDKRFTTAPEDGSRFTIANGDRLVIGQSVYVVRVE